MVSWMGRRWRTGLLLACGAAAMQVLAGHMQYAYYTAIAAAAYCAARMIVEPGVRRRALPGLAVSYAAAAALSAVQLMPGMAAVDEGVRQTRLAYSVAGMFSLPPENLATFIAPGFLGVLNPLTYWGRCYLWEMSVFVGVSGLVLAAAAYRNPDSRERTRMELAIAGTLLVLALGVHTPLFRALYAIVPEFDRFRGVSKFTYPAILFLVLAVGRGADLMAAGASPRGRLPALVAQAAAVAGLAGFFLREYPECIAPLMRFVERTKESYVAASVYADREFIHGAGVRAGGSLLCAAGVLVLLSASLALAPRRPLLRWVPLALLSIEMLGFAKSHFAWSRTADAMPPALRAYAQARPGDYRVYDGLAPDNGYLLGVPDVGGLDPLPLKRYAEFAAYTQGADPDKATGEILFKGFPPIMTMLRFSYAFMPKPDSANACDVVAMDRKPMARVQLVTDYRVLPDRNAIFAALSDPGFDPRKTALLESEPYPRPRPSSDPGDVRVTRVSTDELVIEANVASPALLLVTDLYSRDWRAQALPGSVQAQYQVMPANYVIRAVPLAAGHHAIRMVYIPSGFRLGAMISIAAWVVLAIVALRWRKGKDGPR
jgi:hypothetical protein